MDGYDPAGASDIELLIEDSPNLAHDVARIVADETKRAVRNATCALIRHGEGSPEGIVALKARRYTKNQVRDDRFPGDPSRRQRGEGDKAP